MKRRLLIGLLAGSMVVFTVPAAAADDALAEYLEQASTAEFHGDGVVMCRWGTDTAAALYDVTRAEGMSMIHAGDGELMTSGNLMTVRSGANWYGTEVEEWTAWELSDRYSLSEAVETSRLGRPAFSVTVLEEGSPRARLVVDSESTVPLLTEVFDGEGRVFRAAVLVEFSSGTQDMPGEMPQMMEMGISRRTAAPDTLPAETAGYRRADVYAGEGDTIQAFYTDGLFSFSVFETARRRPEQFDAATRFEVGDEEYRRIVSPGNIWVHWDAPDRSYVLVGDLPPDHLIEVLRDLPEPGQRGLLVRLWRRLFG